MFAAVFVLTFSLFVAAANCKKYDVNAECIKLYGEDLNTVVKRFRRTPAYLTILMTRVHKMESHLTDVMLQEFTWYCSNRLPDKIKEKFPMDATTVAEATTTTKKVDDRRLYDVKRMQGEREITVDTTETTTVTEAPAPGNSSARRMDSDEAIMWFPRRRRVFYRRDDEGTDSGESSGQANATQSPVMVLDDIRESDSNMTVDDINEARNIGFEAFGDVIHNIIRDMGGTIQDDQSTQMPGGGYVTNSTSTTHAQKHTVGDSNEDSTTASTKTADGGVTDNTL